MSLKRFRVQFSVAAINDLRTIARHLEHTTGNIAGAVRRTKEIRAFALSIGALPHQGMRRDELRKGLRTASIGRAIIAFEVDDSAELVRVLGLFYGGQDHDSILLGRITPDAD